MASSLPQGEVIKLRGVRLSFPHLKTPKKFDEDNEKEEAKFQASFLLDPGNDDHKKMIRECDREIKRLKSESGIDDDEFKPLQCFGKGDKKKNKKTKEPYDGYAGMYFVSSSNIKRPVLKDSKGNNLTPEEAEQMMYGGCYVHANVNFWVQDNKFGQAINCSLRGVVFCRDGEAFGAGAVSDDEFDDVLEGGEIDLDDDDLDLDGDLGL